MDINWKVRFNRNNKTFLVRFAVAVFVPALTYFGLAVTDLTSWSVVLEVLLKAVSNPYVLGITLFNAWNVLSDPTTSGFGDSERAMEYKNPN